MVGGHDQPGVRVVLGQALAELVGHPLGHLAGVHEDQGRAVAPHVVGDAVEHLGELAVRGHRLELGVGQLDGHVEVPAVPAVDDRRGRSVGGDAAQEPGHHLERPLGGRQPDALEPAAGRLDHPGQALEAERQVRAPLVPGQGVHLVDDHRAHPAPARPATTAAVRSR